MVLGRGSKQRGSKAVQNVYINRKATDLMSYYVNLAEQGKAEVILISASCIGFCLASSLVK